MLFTVHRRQIKDNCSTNLTEFHTTSEFSYCAKTSKGFVKIYVTMSWDVFIAVKIENSLHSNRFTRGF